MSPPSRAGTYHNPAAPFVIPQRTARRQAVPMITPLAAWRAAEVSTIRYSVFSRLRCPPRHIKIKYHQIQ